MKVSVPSQHPVKVIDFPRLDGGLNLWELDYRLDKNQSPEMKNLWWQDGVLQCRDGQEYLCPTTMGTGYTCYQELFWDHAFFHISDKLYSVESATSPEVGETRALTELCSGVPEQRGTFFRYGDWLMYKNRGGFFKITYKPDTAQKFAVTRVTDEAYTPVILLNADPTTGSGDMYQPENRLSAKKTVRYNAKAGVKTYQLPVTGIDSIVDVKVDGAATTGYTADLAKGTVTFNTEPPVTEPATNNTVEITFSKANPDALASIMDCPYAVVFGGDTNVCMVLGGSTKQPNAFFWNGNDSVGMNAAYWPMAFYNLAGDTEDKITGFGKQYSDLIVFKERSVGKASYDLENIDDRASIAFTYVNINSRIGCDLPWTIQLVENNLTFCNTQGGVHVVRDSSSALENNIVGISRNVNGTDQRPGLLQDLRSVDRDTVCSFDDDNRYWVCANGHVYAWDYLLSTHSDPSWFYFTEIPGIAYIRNVDKSFHMDRAGRVTLFQRNFADYGNAIEKVYQFPPQFFDTYDRLKDVLYCIFTVRSDTDSMVDILYQTDYEDRADMTPIRSMSWRLVPRNLAYRCLGVQKFAHVARRKTGCRHVRHFSVRLTNAVVRQDLAILSAQIYFRFLGRDR